MSRRGSESTSRLDFVCLVGVGEFLQLPYSGRAGMPVFSFLWEGDLLMEMEMGGVEQSVDGAVVEYDNVV